MHNLLKSSLVGTSLTLISLLFSSIGWAQAQYITDVFEVTLRSGPSTSNSIISMLKSGDKLKLIEQDNDTKYSHVETESGKQGYILTRFLDNEASGRARASKLLAETDSLKATIKELRQERDEFKKTKNSDNADIERLKQDLTRTENELTSLKTATHDSILILQQNEELKSLIEQLEDDKQMLTEENTRYKDSTAMDWFIRGASVALIAFLLGIIVTRIRWKKRDSWGSY